MTPDEERRLNNNLQIQEDLRSRHIHIYRIPSIPPYKQKASPRGRVKIYTEGERLVFAMRKCRENFGGLTYCGQ